MLEITLTLNSDSTVSSNEARNNLCILTGNRNAGISVLLLRTASNTASLMNIYSRLLFVHFSYGGHVNMSIIHVYRLFIHA